MIHQFLKKANAIGIVLSFLLIFSAAGFAADKQGAVNLGTRGLGQKNVIVLMTDGTGSAHTTITRWYKGSDLALDQMFMSGVRTYGSNSLITDSAPAATAFATGLKSQDKFVGVLPDQVTIPGLPSVADDKKYRPIATILEAAKVAGKSVGLIATSNIQHASPAGYSAHVRSRSDYNEIAEQQVYLDIDVVFGAGKSYLVPTDQGGKRTDGEDLIQVLKNRGYTYIETRQDLLNLPAGTRKVWGMFSQDAMAYEFDRRAFPDYAKEPSLAEMTQKAIEILSRNPRGFFLFVEASKVDWASHANDPIGVISDLLAFDEAVEKSLDFAKDNRNTLVMAFSDHGNGGMSLGSKKTDNTYSSLPFSTLVEPLKKATLTGEGIEKKLGSDRSAGNIEAVMAQYFGITDLTTDERETIQSAPAGSMNYVVGPMISNRSVIGWTTNGHVGDDLFFYYYGLYHPMTILENTDIAYLGAHHLHLNLRAMDNYLFQPADLVFPALGATISIDSSNPANKVLVVTKGAKTARLPFSKDVIQIGGNEYRMNGITVYADKALNAQGGQGRVFVPHQALEFFQRY